MKRKVLFAVVCAGLLFAFSLSQTVMGGQDGEIPSDKGPKQVSCSIYDELGNPITSAQAGDVVQLYISHPSITGPTRQFIFRVPSSDPATYQDTFLYVKKYSGTSSGGYIYMKIQPYTYVEGTGVFIGNVPGHGYCYKTLQVTQP